MVRCGFLAWMVAAVMGMPMGGHAQASGSATDAGAVTSFEVASMKMVPAHTPQDWQRGIGVFSVCTYPTARFFMHNASLGLLIGLAYGGDNMQNLPDWASSQQYDVEATVEGERPLTREQMQPLLQNLLEQRLHLKVHHETRLVSGYDLVVDKAGAKLKTADVKTRPAELPSAYHAQVYSGHVDGWDVSIATLAHIMASPVGSPVADKTGLAGSYDIHLVYRESADEDSSLPSIFTAVQEQLGLKLVAAKVSVDHLVIDHVDKVPTEN